MAKNSSALTGVGHGSGPSIKEAMAWLSSLMQQGVDPNTRLKVETTPHLSQFDQGGWSIECHWEKP